MHRISDGEALTRVRWINASLRFDIALRNLELALKAGFDPNEPRVPAGNPDGGQWTTGGGGGSIRITVDQPKPSSGNGPPVSFQPRPIPTDAGAPRARPAQYTITESGRTGNPKIDTTTEALSVAVATAMETVEFIPRFTPAMYGTAVHTAFAGFVRAANLPGVSVEQSFLQGEADRRTLGSVRTDVLLRDETGKILAIHDLKTGGATLRPSRVEQLRRETNATKDVPVIELHFTRGASLKNGAITEDFPADSAPFTWNDPVQGHPGYYADRSYFARIYP